MMIILYEIPLMRLLQSAGQQGLKGDERKQQIVQRNKTGTVAGWIQNALAVQWWIPIATTCMKVAPTKVGHMGPMRVNYGYPGIGTVVLFTVHKLIVIVSIRFSFGMKKYTLQ
eukprot:scaffold414_cov109-Cylindrotheca_fusiformis.AAC.18